MEKSENYYEPFSDLLPESEFVKFFDALGEKNKLSFERAILMYKRAIVCKDCDSDVSIALLCSAVETVSCGSNIIFKDWLLKNRGDELANRNIQQVKDILNRAYEDYLKSEEREGIAYNFRRFLIEYCPENLKNPPIKVYKGTRESFDIAIRGIYSRFRSLFLHEGIGYAGTIDKPVIDEETKEPVNMIGFPLLMKTDGNYVAMELSKITDWFSEVVKSSLLQCLMKERTMNKPV